MTLKLAFVGCGEIAQSHLAGIENRARRVRITAAVDTNADNAKAVADRTGAAVFPSLEAALADGDFDAVDLMLPHDLHESAALAAFTAGKHVLLEKPMAPTLDACERILAAAGAAGTVFMVAENAQYMPPVVKAQQLIQEGAIGSITTARASFAMTLDPRWYRGTKPWRYDKGRVGGGNVIDGGSHWIRPLRMWLGEIDQVVAVLGHPLKQMEGESLAHSIFRFRSGTVATFDVLVDDTVLAPAPWFHITGSDGQIVVPGWDETTVKLFNKTHREGQAFPTDGGYWQSFGYELEDFAAAVLDGKKPAAGPEDSLGELRTALAVYESARTGTWQSVWDD